MSWLLALLLFRTPDGGWEILWPPRFPHAAGPVRALLFVLGAALLCAASWWLYRREPSFVDARRKRVLAVLRATGFLVVLFALTGATLDMRAGSRERTTLALVVDRSASMAIADRRSGPELAQGARMLGIGESHAAERLVKTTRSQLVEAVMNREGGALARLAERYDLRVFGFGDGEAIEPIALDAGAPRLDLGTPRAPATRLGSALREARRTLAGTACAGVVLVTDGGSNQGEDPLQAVRDTAVPVHAIGVGLPVIKDIAVPFLLCDDVVFKDDQFTLHVRIRQRGYDGKQAKLVVRRDQQVVAERPLTFSARGEWTEEVKVVPDTAGTFSFSATVEPFPDELTAANNTAVKPAVRVIDEKVKVFVCEDSYRFEFRYLRSALEADDKRIEPRFLVRAMDPETLKAQQVRPVQGPTGTQAPRAPRFLAEFPAKAADLKPLQLVVLGDVPAALLPKEKQELLAQWVKDGGALLVIAGPAHMPGAYLGSALAELLPVEPLPQAAPTPEQERAATTTGFQAKATIEGERAPWLRFAEEPVENDRLWRECSSFFWFSRCGRPKAGASVLLTHPTEQVDGAPMPLMADGRVGRGRVIYLGTDEIWRWRFRPGAVQHRRFWGQVVNALALSSVLGGSSRIQLATDKSEYGIGEQAAIVAKVLDKDFRPLKAASVTAILERGDARQELKLAAQAGQEGVFQSSVPVPVEGTYRLTLQGEPQPERRFVVGPPRLELADPALREDLLQAVARGGGGRYVPLHRADELVEELLRSDAGTTVRREELSLWNAPGLILLLVLAFGTEWFLRKRWDLL